MKMRRTWVALGGSLAIHAAVVAVLAVCLMQPHRIVNRVEVDLEGVALPGAPPGLEAPSPVAGPEMHRPASLPSTVSVPTRLAVTPTVTAAPAAPRFDPDGELQAPAIGGVPAPTGVALSVPGGGAGGPGAGNGPGVKGGGEGRRGGGSGSALAGYLHAIRARVDAAKRYPQMAQQRRQEGVAVVTFHLTLDGRLSGTPAIVKSSGYAQLDKAALLAVERGEPYPRFPLDPQEMRPLEIPVKFSLR